MRTNAPPKTAVALCSYATGSSGKKISTTCENRLHAVARQLPPAGVACLVGEELFVFYFPVDISYRGIGHFAVYRGGIGLHYSF